MLYACKILYKQPAFLFKHRNLINKMIMSAKNILIIVLENNVKYFNNILLQ